MAKTSGPTLAAFVIGTRAQLIKMAPVVAACERRNLPCRIVLTGQHQETMTDLIAEFGLRSPVLDAAGGTERATVGSLLKWLPRAWSSVTKLLRTLVPGSERIDVLVHGDTASTVLGALVGRRLRHRVIHVESGLSSGRILDPFPEEIFRRIVFRLTQVAFCPDRVSAELMHTRHPKVKTIQTAGNSILDALMAVLPDGPPAVEAGTLVASLHRFQNLFAKGRLEYLVDLLCTLAKTHRIKFVLHPATRKRLFASGLIDRLQSTANIELLPRLGYKAFLTMAASAECVLTDGGSNQEELAALGIPTIVMREATERLDGLGGPVVLEADVPGNVADFIRLGQHLSLRRAVPMKNQQSPSEQIAAFLEGNGTP